MTGSLVVPFISDNLQEAMILPCLQTLFKDFSSSWSDGSDIMTRARDVSHRTFVPNTS